MTKIRSLAVTALALLFLAQNGSGSEAEAKARAPVIRLRDDYRIHTEKITISGHSSGASFVHIFHIAHSRLIFGVGILAGLYYRYNGIPAEVEDWKDDPPGKGVNQSVAAITEYSKMGLIDPMTNMRNSRIYIWAGTADEFHGIQERVGSIVTIYEPYLRSTQQLYTKVQYASHRFPSGHCDAPVEKDGYDGSCHYDAFLAMLEQFFGKPIRVSNGPFNEIQEFDQTEFFRGIPGEIAMRDTGLLYVPLACRPTSAYHAQRKCRLHFHFHGCDEESKYDAYEILEQMGLGKAEGNNIITVFPRTKPTVESPVGCWDYLGWTGSGYPTKEASQVRVVRRMIKRLTGR